MSTSSASVRRSLPAQSAPRWALTLLLSANLLAACGGKEEKGQRGTDDGGALVGGDGGANADAGSDEGNGDGDDGPGDGDGSGDGDDGPVSCSPVTCEAKGSSVDEWTTVAAASSAAAPARTAKYCAPDASVCGAARALHERECGAAIDACDDPVVCGSSCVYGRGVQGRSVPSLRAHDCTAESLCDDVPDGCGGTLHCVACAEGMACDKVTHQCTACEKTSCLGEGVECGVISDGCGGTLDCKTCTADKMCMAVEVGAQGAARRVHGAGRQLRRHPARLHRREAQLRQVRRG